MKREYNIGDKAWIYLGNHHGKKTESTVVHSFQLGWGPVYYVCEVSTPIDPLLEVRSAMSMAESADAGIGLEEAARKFRDKVLNEQKET